MKLFTPRFIKDVLLSVLFFILYYGLTHNSLVYPTTPVFKGTWSIEKLQHPLVLRLAGHNYLALRDDKGKIVSELHGLATDEVTGVWKYIGTGNNELLKVWEFDTRILDPTSTVLPGIVLKTGDEASIKSLWEKARVCKEKINEKHIPYPPLGISFYETENSNSVAYTLTKCIGAENKHIGIIVPGEETDLLK
jgi:hypothetical protein